MERLGDGEPWPNATGEALDRPIRTEVWLGAATFSNPWEEFRLPCVSRLVKFLLTDKRGTKGSTVSQEELEANLPVHELTDADYASLSAPPTTGLRMTWVGHATCYVQFDGISLLTDPIFSYRASPFGRMGPVRYRPAPFTPAKMKVHNLPLDAVVISHTHYDHLDANSVKELNEQYGDALSWFVPVGLKSWILGCGVLNVKELTWWTYAELRSALSTDTVRMACVPSQHWCLRAGQKRNTVLWCGWAVVGPRHSFYFAGDTGYNSSSFKQIGRVVSEYRGATADGFAFDLSAIPIGAFLPRDFMKSQHVDPTDAVLVHKDVKSRHSVGVHWGTYDLGYEHYMAPKSVLRDCVQAASLDPDRDFTTVQHGKPVLYSDQTG